MLKKASAEYYIGKYISFSEKAYDDESKFWEVGNFKDGTFLGYIEYFARWSKFAFFNYQGEFVFEENCLRDIADFIVMKTEERKSE